MQTDLPTAVESWIDRFRFELGCLGELREANGRVDIEGTSLSIASSIGGKLANQDAAVIWVPAKPERILWAAAIADGVSQSFYSAFASRLACYASLGALARLERRESLSGFRPIPLCVRLFRSLGTRLGRNPVTLRPEQHSQSNWTRCLRDGRLLQTTLMVAWQVGTRLYVDGVGDGGFILSYDLHSRPMIFVPSSDGPVDCLGVATPLADRDFGHEFSKWQRFCMFTDGAGEGLKERPEAAMELIRRAALRRNREPAAQLLRVVERWSSNPIDDNLTLFAVTKAIAG